MKKLSKLLLGLILSFMVIQVPLALNHSVYALDDETTEDVITPKSGLMYEDNQFVYYSDGEVNKDFKGLAEYEGEKYYVQNGTVDTKLTDVVYIDGTWYYIDKGRLNEETRDVIYHCGGWYFVENGTIDWTYTGVVEHCGGYFYVEKGQINWDYTGACKTDGVLYYIRKGSLDTSKNGLTYVDGTWFLLEKGKLKTDYTGLVQYEGRWYYVENGILNWGYTGLTKYYSTWYMVVNGQLDWKFNDVTYYFGTWYYVENGKLNWNFTDLFQYFGTWYYIRGGVLDWNYTGLAYHAGGYYYIDHGVLDQNSSASSQSQPVNQSFVANMSISHQTTQAITVIGDGGSYATLTVHTKHNGVWTETLSCSARVGRNGITGNKREGDGKTPRGIYSFGQAFGVAGNPGTSRRWLQVNNNHYWVDDVNSSYYNKLVDASQTGIQWSSAEHLISYPTAYRYAIALNYNTACTPGAGSAIFLHCSTGGATAGCISVSQSDMIRILKMIQGDTLIGIYQNKNSLY